MCFRMFYFDNTLDISGWTLIAKLELSKLGTGVQFRDLNDQNGVYEYLRPGLPGINWSGFNWLEQNWISDQDGMGESLTSIQCYKTFTGLYLQVCKYRAIFNSLVATNIAKFMLLMLDSWSICYLKVKTRIKIWN